MEIQKYFHEGVLDTYFETESTPYFKITKGYSNQGVLFDTVVIYKNSKGNPYIYYDQIDQEPGFYRRINSEGALSNKTFEDFYTCMFHPGEDLT